MNTRIKELKTLLAYRPTDDDRDLPTRAEIEPMFNEFKQLVADASAAGEDVEMEEMKIRTLQKMLDAGRFH